MLLLDPAIPNVDLLNFTNVDFTKVLAQCSRGSPNDFKFICP